MTACRWLHDGRPDETISPETERQYWEQHAPSSVSISPEGGADSTERALRAGTAVSAAAQTRAYRSFYGNAGFREVPGPVPSWALEVDEVWINKGYFRKRKIPLPPYLFHNRSHVECTSALMNVNAGAVQKDQMYLVHTPYAMRGVAAPILDSDWGLVGQRQIWEDFLRAQLV